MSMQAHAQILSSAQFSSRSSPRSASARRAARTGRTRRAARCQAPMFEVDPLWPKPLPNHWLLGMTIGVWVDDQDHIWIIHRSSATLHANERALELGVGECCRGAPPVLVFDQAGNLVRAWGGPGRRLRVAGCRTTASTWTTRATCGSAATARPTRTSSSSPRKGSS